MTVSAAFCGCGRLEDGDGESGEECGAAGRAPDDGTCLLAASSVLAKSDVARFIELTMGHTASKGLITAVHLKTDGNPLLVSELVRLLAHEGGLERVGDTVSWRVSLPQGTKRVIRRASPALRTRTVASF